jgi:amino acid adenylation domain-containing protein
MIGQRAGEFFGATLTGESRTLFASSVVELIQRHARTRPDAVALECGDTTTSYRQLWRRAMALAATLVEMDVQPGDIIGVVARRTPETIAAMIAVMAVRAAYVPVDPTNPVERVRLILDQAKPQFVLWDGVGDDKCAFGLPALDTSTVPTTDSSNRPVSGSAARLDDVAYVVFTSGSTGVPKGVLIEHRSLVNYVGWAATLVLPDAGGAACPVFASLSFDLALTTLWVPLAHGRTIVMVENSWDYAALFAERSRPYDFVKATPSHFRLFERILRPAYGKVTTTLLIGGEPLEPAMLARMADRLDGVHIVNHYGPTETTIGCCAHRFTTAEMPALPTVPIGRPAWNTAAYVVDDGGNPVRHGEAGELIVSGFGIARGYLGGDGSRFLDAAEFGGRAYHTGDIVEVRPDGVLLHLGRADSQLKVNGHRFEMAELCRHALTLPRVADAAFDVIRGDTMDVVEAFVVFDDKAPTSPPSEQEIRARLRAFLPPELVPERVHAVPEIKFDANGKRDLRATRALVDAVAGGRRRGVR